MSMNTIWRLCKLVMTKFSNWIKVTASYGSASEQTQKGRSATSESGTNLCKTYPYSDAPLADSTGTPSPGQTNTTAASLEGSSTDGRPYDFATYGLHNMRYLDVPADGYSMRHPSDVKYVMIHRIGLNNIPRKHLTAEDLVEAFGDTSQYAAGSYTGGLMPYTFFIDYDGGICQCLPLTYVAPHAKKWNRTSVSIALAGDFRKDKPTIWQADALDELLCKLAWLGAKIVGHTEMPGSTGTAGKECPGDGIDLDALRAGMLETLEGHGITL